MQIYEITTQFKLYRLYQNNMEKYGVLKEREDVDEAPEKARTLRNLRRGTIQLKEYLTPIRKKEMDKKGSEFLSVKQAGGAVSVNPFLTDMFFRISFQAWRSVTKRHEKERRLRKKEIESPFGSPAKRELLSPKNQEGAEEIEITLPPVEELYTSDESEGEETVIVSKSILEQPRSARRRQSVMPLTPHTNEI